MAVTGVLLAAIASITISLLGVSRTATVKTSTTADARIAMEAMTRSLRVAVVPKGEAAAITVSEPAKVEFYSSLDRTAGQTAERPTRVTYSYLSPCVNETQVVATINPDAAKVAAQPHVWAGTGTTRCLIRTRSAPTFTYFTSGTILQSDGSAVPAVLPTTSAARAAIVSVEIALDVQDPTLTGVRGVVARDRVTLMNIRTTT